MRWLLSVTLGLLGLVTANEVVVVGQPVSDRHILLARGRDDSEASGSGLTPLAKLRMHGIPHARRPSYESPAATPSMTRKESLERRPSLSPSMHRMMSQVYVPKRRTSFGGSGNGRTRMLPLLRTEGVATPRPHIRRPELPVGPQPKKTVWGKMKKKASQMAGCFVGDPVKCT